jgi:hypothetical protein
MFVTIKNNIVKIRANLTRLGENQPISKAALVIILFLDIFILIAIFNGLDEHTRQLASPDEHVPYDCRQIVIDSRWNETNRLDNLSGIILPYSTSYYPVEEKKPELHPVCAPFLEQIETIKKDKDLVRMIETRRKYLQESKELESGIAELKGAYDTALLESIAKKQGGGADVGTIQKDLRRKSAALDALRAQITVIESRINRSESVQTLWGKIASLQEQARERLKTDLRSLNFWFPLKKLGMQMLFLLPLFVFFYAWNNVSIRKSRGVQTLVSSHLLVVSFIPIFFKIIDAVLDIIPKKLIKKIIDLLESLKLVAIWHYLIIAISVAVALFLIYIFQKKLFSREKLIERRIARGLCQQCGRHLPPESRACPFCGFAQYKTCPECSKPAHVYGKHCRECGSVLP